jgi:transcriptional regulator with XRE-family HTH domain
MRESTAGRAPTDVDVIVGENLRTIRKAQNLTLAELSGQLGISHQQLQKYEVGTNRISAGMLHQIAEMLNTPMAELFIGAEDIEEVASEVEAVRAQCIRLLRNTDSADYLNRALKVLRAI